jgi:heme-degrading monooxygenase HmoA
MADVLPQTSVQESVTIDMWDVSAGRQEEVTAALRTLLERLRLTDGFLDGRIFASGDGTKVISYSMMRSAADRQHALEQDGIRDGLQRLEAIAAPDRDSYELACVFTAHPHGPTVVSPGAF